MSARAKKSKQEILRGRANHARPPQLERKETTKNSAAQCFRFIDKQSKEKISR